MISCPKPFVMLHNHADIFGYVPLEEYRKLHGRDKANLMDVGRRISALQFTDGPSDGLSLVPTPEPFGSGSVFEGMGVTAKGLMQLMIFSPRWTGNDEISTQALALFLDDAHGALRAAQDYFCDVIGLMAGAVEDNGHPGNWDRYQAHDEWKVNSQFWNHVLPLSSPKNSLICRH